MPAVTAITISAALVFGMALALLGSVKQALAKRLDLGEGRVGLLLLAFNVLFVPMVALSGVLIDRWSVRGVVLLGSVLLAVGVFSLGVRLTYRGALLALAVAGMGGAGVGTAAVVLMPRAFLGRDLVLGSLALGGVFSALGALLAPPLAFLLTSRFGLRRAAALFALPALLPAVLAALPWAGVLDAGQPPPAGGEELFGQASLWLAGLALFFYAPLEAAVSVWATAALAAAGATARQASTRLAGFWVAFLASRLLIACGQQTGFLPTGWDSWLPVLAALLAAVALGNLAGTAREAALRVGLPVLGFALGPVFPAVVALLFRHEGHQTGTAYGVVFALASLGGFLIAPLLTAVARRSLPAALYAALVLALLLTASVLPLGLIGP